jgi:hypothetical protein
LSRHSEHGQSITVSFSLCSTNPEALNNDDFTTSENRKIASLLLMLRSKDESTGDVPSAKIPLTEKASTPFTIAFTATPVISLKTVLDICMVK